jgi:4-hydroxybenzoate polyprenyltransferase
VVIAIHLAQSLPDLAGDRRRGERGLAVALGPRRGWAIVWSAAFGSAAAIGLLSWRVGERPVPGIVAAVIAALVLAATLTLDRRHPARVRAHIFEVLAVSAVILGLGWVGTM